MAELDGEPVAGLSSQQQELAGQGIPSTWNTYVNVDNVGNTTAKAVAAGAQVIAPPMDIGDSGRMAIVRDPSGTADVDATVAKAAELGATVLVPATDSPIGKFAFFRDPTGAAFSVVTAGQTS